MSDELDGKMTFQSFNNGHIRIRDDRPFSIHIIQFNAKDFPVTLREANGNQIEISFLDLVCKVKEYDNLRAHVAALREVLLHNSNYLASWLNNPDGINLDYLNLVALIGIADRHIKDTTAAAQAHDARVWNAAIDAAIDAYAAEMSRRAEVYGLSFDQKISGYVSIFESLKKERDQ